MCTHESWAAGGWERSALLGEAWKSGRNVPEQGAADAATVREITSKIDRRHEGMPRWARRPRRGRARARGELFAPFLRRVSSSAWYWSFCGCSRAGPARRRPAWTASPLRCKICRGSARRRELLRRAAEEAVARRVCLVLRVALISMRVVRCEVLVSVLCLWTRVQACSWRRAP